MKKTLAIIALLFVTFVLAGKAIADEEPVMTSGQPEVSARTRRLAAQYEMDIRQGRLYAKSNQALDAIIRLAVYKLHRVGEHAQAKKLLKEWEGQWQYALPSLALMDGIGDHRPLSQWLAEKYYMLELILGKDVCHALRLDDIHTINYAIPVVLRCIDDVDEVEFALHFVHDSTQNYRGLGPVVAYWTTFFTCVGATWGTGFLFCSPIAMGVEYLAKGYVCPKLNKSVWRLSCSH